MNMDSYDVLAARLLEVRQEKKRIRERLDDLTTEAIQLTYALAILARFNIQAAKPTTAPEQPGEPTDGN